MFRMGILNGSRQSNKEWTVTCPNKPSRHKTRYVHDGDYTKYMLAKNKEKNSIKDIKT